jgi:predicted amidohydrolase
MRIGHFQIEAKTGQFEANLDKIKDGLTLADRDRVEIVCFPECCLTGYPDNEEVARRDAFTLDSSSMMKVLDATGGFQATAIVGFNELRGRDLYNTAAVIQQGHLLGTFSKCSAYQKFHKQGREFPVFERGGVKFGVVICSDGGYIEPARILVFKGAKIIFSPHYNYLSKDAVVNHFQKVRADHVARAVENQVYFVRGNNVNLSRDEGIKNGDGVGYGDSYIVDPLGEIIVRTRRFHEDFIFADLDLKLTNDKAWGGTGRSRWSWQEFGKILDEAANAKT